MSAALHTHDRHPHILRPPTPVAPARVSAALRVSATPRASPRAFAGTVARYVLLVTPTLKGQLDGWRAAAHDIPDPGLRALALASHVKRGNIEGAALLATLAPRPHRHAAVTAQVAFQTLYNYLDMLSEQPCEEPSANAEALHQALLDGLAPGSERPDYYRHCQYRADGGYLLALVRACRQACERLPSFSLVAPAARDAAERIVDFQTLTVGARAGDPRALVRWASETTPSHAATAWWETAAAAGSSLPVYALIAAAARPDVGAHEVRAIERAYFPWIGALHTLLDSLVDRDEDRAARQPSLLEPYGTLGATTDGLAELARRARDEIAGLPRAQTHRAILTAMCSYYLSAPESGSPEGQAVRARLTGLLGPSLSAAMLLFAAKRRLHHLTSVPFA